MNKQLTQGKRRLKKVGLVILIVPILILAAFAVGEGLSPEFGASGFILHFLQVLPLLMVLYIAWRWPAVGGWILIIAGLLLALLFMFAMGGELPMKFFTLLMLFVPPVVAGWFLVASANKN